jgi:hypothetical protein
MPSFMKENNSPVFLHEPNKAPISGGKNMMDSTFSEKKKT